MLESGSAAGSVKYFPPAFHFPVPGLPVALHGWKSQPAVENFLTHSWSLSGRHCSCQSGPGNKDS